MKIKHKHELLMVDIILVFNDKKKLIENMVLDTGAAKTLISQDAVEDIGIQVDIEDTIVTYFGIGGKEHAFRKRIDQVQLEAQFQSYLSSQGSGGFYE